MKLYDDEAMPHVGLEELAGFVGSDLLLVAVDVRQGIAFCGDDIFVIQYK